MTVVPIRPPTPDVPQPPVELPRPAAAGVDDPQMGLDL